MDTRSTGLTGGALVGVLAMFFVAGACGPKAGSTAPDAGAPAAAPGDFPAQVALGQRLYGEHCAACHGAGGEGGRGPRVVGLAEGALPLEPPADRTLRTGKFVTVADVATFVVANMPPGQAGTLTTEDYLAILAFDLKANGIDPGQEALTLARAGTLTIPR